MQLAAPRHGLGPRPHLARRASKLPLFSQSRKTCSLRETYLRRTDHHPMNLEIQSGSTGDHYGQLAYRF